MKSYYNLLYLSFFFIIYFAQGFSQDSTKNKYNSEINNIRALINYSYAVRDSSPTLALQYFKQAIEENSKFKNNHIYFYAYIGAGVCNNILGNYPDALDHLFKAYRYADTLENNEFLSESSNLIGEVLTNCKLNNFAIKFFEKSITLHRKIGETQKTAQVFSNIASYYLYINMLDSSRKFINQSIEINNKYNLKNLIAKDKIKLALLDFSQNNFEMALNGLFEQLDYFMQCKDRISQLIIYEYLGEIYLKLGTLDNSFNSLTKDDCLQKSELYFLQAEKIAKDLKANNHLIYIYRNLYLNKKESGQPENAYKYLESHYFLKNQIQNSEYANKISSKLVEYLMDIIANKVKQSKTHSYYFYSFFAIFILIIVSIIINLRKSKIVNSYLKNQNILFNEARHELEILLENITLREKQLEIANAAKDKFISIIAHDIKNPLHAITFSSELLFSSKITLPKEQVFSSIKSIHHSAVQLNYLLDSILNWAKIQRNQIEFCPQLLDAYYICDKAINLMQDIADNKNIKLVNNLPKEMNVIADENILFTVLRNLLSNAIKFTNTGGLIYFGIDYEANSIFIQDNGVGMPKAIVENVFKLDSIVRRKGTNAESGSGLGLILCKELIEMHGGEIWIESAENVGTAVHFTLLKSTMNLKARKINP